MAVPVPLSGSASGSASARPAIPPPPGLQLGKNAVSVLRYSKTTVISIIKRINYSNIDNKKNKSIIMPIPGVARFPTHRIIYHLHPAEEGAQFASI